MAAPISTSRPLRLAVSPRTADILRRCYGGEIPQDVLERAALLLAAADGHLDAGNRIKTGRARGTA
ncbi:hypothetical protein [Streptomyces sp900116325]|uniref:hypothetical protein n=1 Tax=Streptomyces sp. 900116325 TaxID=3154295 RepID=UPI003401A4B5